MKLFKITFLFVVVSVSQNAIADCLRVENDMKIFAQTIAEKRQTFAQIPTNPQEKPWVIKKIEHMVDVDQYLRGVAVNWEHDKKYSKDESECFWNLLHPQWEQIDSSNTSDLKELMKIYGWFKISEFGEQTSVNAWLLVQHADLDRVFQKEVLVILEKLYPIGETSAKNYAFLYDRVTWYGDNMPQRYATQGRCVARGDWQPWPTEDFVNVEFRRKSMGMESYASNKARLDQICF